MGDFKGARDFIDRKVAGMTALLDVFGGRMESEAKTSAAWTDRTSAARNTLHHGVVQTARVMWLLFLAYGVEYGEYLEEGTPPHIIRPKDKKALFWEGAPHPVRQVNHPGTKGFNTLHEVIDRNIPGLRGAVDRYWRG
jgi:hypothetical protein